MERRIITLAMMTCLIVSSISVASDSDPFKASVGMSQTIEEVILPGSELEVIPIQDQQPFVLRITEAFAHGTAFRYHFVYYGLEPGEYDLTNYLQRKDGTELGEMPALKVNVAGVLPPGQVRPHELPAPEVPRIGGYQLLLGIAAVVWVIGLALLLRSSRRSVSEETAHAAQPKTLADQLQPLVEAAADGSLEDSQRAELERLLLAYWRRKLDVRELSPADAIAALKANPEAGPLLRQLEEWLHHPNPTTTVDIAQLLKPYANVTTHETSP